MRVLFCFMLFIASVSLACCVPSDLVHVIQQARSDAELILKYCSEMQTQTQLEVLLLKDKLDQAQQVSLL